MLNTRSGSTSVSVSEMASCTLEHLSVVERTRHDASTSRRRLQQPAAIGVAGKDPPKRQVDPNFRLLAKIGLSSSITRIAAGQGSQALPMITTARPFGKAFSGLSSSTFAAKQPSKPKPSRETVEPESGVGTAVVNSKFGPN
jgi:hypothetical protein